MGQLGKSADQRITVTQLLRDSGALLDEVEIDRASFVVHRYGRPVAALIPLDDSPPRRRRVRTRLLRDADVPENDRAAPMDPVVLDEPLDDDEKLLLTSIAAQGKDGWHIAEGEELLNVRKLVVALSRLELARLIQRGGDGPWFYATRAGTEHAAQLEGAHAGG